MRHEPGDSLVPLLTGLAVSLCIIVVFGLLMGGALTLLTWLLS